MGDGDDSGGCDPASDAGKLAERGVEELVHAALVVFTRDGVSRDVASGGDAPDLLGFAGRLEVALAIVGGHGTVVLAMDDEQGAGADASDHIHGPDGIDVLANAELSDLDGNGRKGEGGQPDEVLEAGGDDIRGVAKAAIVDGGFDTRVGGRGKNGGGSSEG